MPGHPVWQNSPWTRLTSDRQRKLQETVMFDVKWNIYFFFLKATNYKKGTSHYASLMASRFNKTYLVFRRNLINLRKGWHKGKMLTEAGVP